MPTIPIFIRQRDYEHLLDIARARKTSVAALVREAIAMYLKHVPTRTQAKLRPINVSQRGDLSWRENEENIGE